MRDFKLFILVFFMAMAVPIPAGAQEEDDQESFVEAVANELKKEEYQKDLPVPENNNINLPNISLPSWLGGFFTLFFWGVVALLIVFLIYSIAKYLDNRGDDPRQGKGPKEHPVRPMPKVHSKPKIPGLSDIETLATEGQYAEAIHGLLLLALDHIFIALRSAPPKADTSREILRDDRILQVWKKDLETLVSAVEEALFARKAPTKEKYEVCKRNFDHLASNVKGGK